MNRQYEYMTLGINVNNTMRGYILYLGLHVGQVTTAQGHPFPVILVALGLYWVAECLGQSQRSLYLGLGCDTNKYD